MTGRLLAFHPVKGPTKTEIGAWLRRARHAAREAAPASERPSFAIEGVAQQVGVRERAVRSWEAGETAPTTDLFLQLVRLYRAEKKLLVLLGTWESFRGGEGGEGRRKKAGGE